MKAMLKNARISEKKMALAAKLARNSKNISDAQMQLKFANKKSCDILFKVLNSAIANSKLSLEELQIDRIEIGRGTMNRRKFNPRARGRSDILVNRYTNILIKLRKIGEENGK